MRYRLVQRSVVRDPGDERWWCQTHKWPLSKRRPAMTPKPKLKNICIPPIHLWYEVSPPYFQRTEANYQPNGARRRASEVHANVVILIDSKCIDIPAIDCQSVNNTSLNAKSFADPKLQYWTRKLETAIISARTLPSHPNRETLTRR